MLPSGVLTNVPSARAPRAVPPSASTANAVSAGPAADRSAVRIDMAHSYHRGRGCRGPSAPSAAGADSAKSGVSGRGLEPAVLERHRDEQLDQVGDAARIAPGALLYAAQAV